MTVAAPTPLGWLRRRLRATGLRRSAWAIVLGCATMLLLLSAMVGTAFWDTRDAARVRAEESLGNLALSLERSLVRDLATYDFVLRAVAEGHRSRPGQALADVAQAPAYAQVARLEFLGSLTVVDGNGVLTTTARVAPNASSIAGRSDFAAHRADARLGLVAGALEAGTVTGRPKILLSRRLETPDGRFDGIVYGNVKLDYFRQAFENFRLGPGGTVALLSLDGRLLAGSPMRETSMGMDLSRSAVVQRLQTAGPGLFKARSVVDGQERLYSGLQLHGLPFWLVVGTSTADVYADWSNRALASACGAAGFLLLLGMAVTALCSELRRRRRAEIEALASAASARASADLFDLVSSNTDDLILKLDWDGTRRFVSAASQRLIGYSPAELLAGNALAFVHPEDHPLLAARLDDMRRGIVQTCHVTYRLRHRDGSCLSVEARCRALPDRSGAVIVVRDATERIALEGQLRHAQRMEAVGQLTAGVAHDFNNMLQGQIAGLELLMDEVSGQARATRLAEQAISAGEKGAKLTHSLLAFSRQQMLRPEAVDLPRLFDELRQLLSRTFDPGISIEMEVEPGLAHPFADRAQLEAALLNLSLNARDAMQGKGGLLQIEAYGGAVSPDATEGLDNRRCVVIAVSDTGCGMPHDVLAKVCEPFFTTKAIGKGSGLGLSMVQGFARQSGGELRLQSWPGAGTRVQIWLPSSAEAGEAPANAAAGQPSPFTLRGFGQVLLVDDDEVVRTTLCTMLEGAGFDVVTAENGAQATAILQSARPLDVLVSDYGMPGMTGGELVERAMALRPGMPAFIVTGYAENVLLGTMPPHIKVLYKPFRAQDLVRQIVQAQAAGQSMLAAN